MSSISFLVHLTLDVPWRVEFKINSPEGLGFTPKRITRTFLKLDPKDKSPSMVLWTIVSEEGRVYLGRDSMSNSGFQWFETPVYLSCHDDFIGSGISSQCWKILTETLNFKVISCDAEM